MLTQLYKRKNIDDDFIDKCLYVYVINELKNNIYCDVDGLIDEINKFIKNSGKPLKISGNDERNTIKRIIRLNNAIDEYSNNPVINKKPLIINIERYRKRQIKTGLDECYTKKERGYFVVKNITQDNYISFKSANGERSIRIRLCSEILNLFEVGDIIYAELRKNVFFSWQIQEIKICYPKQAQRFLT